MKGKGSLTSLKNKADKLLQLKFLETNKKCIVCGQSPVVGHHYIYKSQSKFLRYQECNMVPLCSTCHTRHHLSGDPRIVQTILKKKGMAWADSLDEKRKVKVKFNKEYLKSIIEELNEQTLR